MTTNRFLELLLAIFLPPVAVALRRGVGPALFVNILLCLFFFIPAVIHALWVVWTPSEVDALEDYPGFG